MFDIGWTEIIVIIVVGSLILDIKDLRKVIAWVRQSMKYINDIFSEFKEIISDLEHETKKIKDLDGDEHIAYDLDDITPDLKEDDRTKRHKK
jgi:Sec-independent protein translocase protein TatA